MIKQRVGSRNGLFSTLSQFEITTTTTKKSGFLKTLFFADLHEEPHWLRNHALEYYLIRSSKKMIRSSKKM